MSNHKTHCSDCGAKTHTYIWHDEDKLCPPCARLRDMKEANESRDSEYVKQMKASINPRRKR